MRAARWRCCGASRRGSRRPPPESPPSTDTTAPQPLLLATRLHHPPRRKNSIPRARLAGRLADALSVPLTLVIAPAGFGKSTLLAEWLAELPTSVTPPVATGWLALAEDNNDLATFVRYLVAALRRFLPEAGDETLALLQSRPALRILLTPLLNDLALLDHESVLVLDDGHTLSNPAVLEALGFLVEHLPPQLHLVIIARAEPPLPLAKLRARGQLVELRAADLRFDRAEAAAFLRTTMQLTVDDDDVAALETRAEGWAAGLQLAALALREASDHSAFVRAFTGSNRYIIDYLAEEVLDSLPVYLRHFLLQTAILERMCGSLCDAALGISDATPTDDSYSQVVLAELERRSLFLIPLDDERRWYRYHHLFAEVLQARLTAGSSRATIAELQRRATRWFHHQGLADEAIHHAVRANDPELLADLVEHYLEIGLSRNDDRVWAWYSQVPAETVGQRPRLALRGVDLLARLNQYDAALRLLESAPVLVTPPDAETAAGAALMRARVLRLRLEDDEARAWLRQAAALMPEGHGPLQAVLALERGIVEGYRGNSDEGLASLDDAIGRFRKLGYDGDALFALSQRFTVLLWSGRLHAARAQISATAWLTQTDVVLTSRVLNVRQAQAAILIEQNRLDEAAILLDDAWAMVKGALEWVPVIYLCWHRARYAYACGDATRALAILEQAKATYAERAGEWFTTFIARYIAMAHLWRGDIDAAAAAIQVSGSRLAMPVMASPFLPLALARIQIAQGRRDHDGALFAQARATIERCMRELYPGLHYWIVTTQILSALLHNALGETDMALTELARALTFGQTQGIVRLFADEGAPMAELLLAARAQGIAPAYCEQLLAAMTPRAR